MVSPNFIVQGFKGKKLKRIPILVCDKPGVNGYLYPREEVEKAIKQYKKLSEIDPTRRYILAKHPETDEERWIGLIAGVVDDLYLEGNILYADCTLLPTIWGYTIAWLLDNGYSVGTSIRGSVKRIEVPYTTKSGETITVKKVTKFTEFEGFDFVLFPSYVLTQAKKENIAESINLYLPQSTTLDTTAVICELSDGKYCTSDCFDEVKVRESSSTISLEKALEKSGALQLLGSERSNELGNNEESYKEEVNKMSKETLEMLELKKAKLELEIERLQNELDKLQKQYKEYEEKVQEQSKRLSSEEKVLEFLAQKKAEVSEVEKVLEQLKSQKEKVAEEIKTLEAQKEQLEASIKELQEKVKEASSGLRVRCCGKTFTEDNPPKLRVVPVEEAVSNKRWGEIDHDTTRKLVYLAKDEEVAKEVFGLVNFNEGWHGLKYPVYEHRKSTEEGYDVDLVLNLNGLRTALIFLLGRPGMALTRKEKRQLVEFLLKKYQMLKEAGIIENIPEVLEKLAQTLKVAESIEVVTNDEIAKALVETAFEVGIVEPEVEDEVKEAVKVEIDPELLYTNYGVAIAKTLEGESLEKVFEQAEGEVQPQGPANRPRTYEEGLETIFNLIADTQVAEALNIQNIEDLDAYIRETIQSLKNGEVAEGLKRIQLLVNAIGRGTIVLTTFVLAADKFAPQNEGSVPEEQEGTTPEEKPEQSTPPVNNAQANQMTSSEEEQQTQVSESATVVTDEPIVSEIRQELNENKDKKETEVNKDEKEVEVKKETFMALKRALEDRFEVEINSEEDLVKVVESIARDYNDIYFAYEELISELRARDALLKLKEEGIEVDEKTKEAIFVLASDPDRLDVLVGELIEKARAKEADSDQEDEKVSEQGKGMSAIDGTTVKDEITRDDKLQRLIQDI